MGRLIDRFNDAVCHRAFSGPEAWTYELLVAAGVANVVTPLLAPHATGRVLDVGCGGGTITRHLGAIGVDASAAQARRARATCASGDALPFARGSFDAVVSSCAIKHLPDPAAGVAEWRRVLRTGGTLAVVEIDGNSTPDEVHALRSGRACLLACGGPTSGSPWRRSWRWHRRSTSSE